MASVLVPSEKSAPGEEMYIIPGGRGPCRWYQRHNWTPWEWVLQSELTGLIKAHWIRDCGKCGMEQKSRPNG